MVRPSCLIGLLALLGSLLIGPLGCGPVAAPAAKKVAAPPPAPPQPAPELAPPPKPLVPPELITKVEELKRLAEEVKTSPPPAVDLDNLDKLQQHVTELAEKQARLSTLAQEILAAHAGLSPEQQAEFERQHLGQSLQLMLGTPPTTSGEREATPM